MNLKYIHYVRNEDHFIVEKETETYRHLDRVTYVDMEYCDNGKYLFCYKGIKQFVIEVNELDEFTIF